MFHPIECLAVAQGFDNRRLVSPAMARRCSTLNIRHAGRHRGEVRCSRMHGNYGDTEMWIMFHDYIALEFGPVTNAQSNIMLSTVYVTLFMYDGWAFIRERNSSSNFACRSIRIHS